MHAGRLRRVASASAVLTRQGFPTNGNLLQSKSFGYILRCIIYNITLNAYNTILSYRHCIRLAGRTTWTDATGTTRLRRRTLGCALTR